MRNLFLFGQKNKGEKHKRNAVRIINGFNIFLLFFFLLISFFVEYHVPHFIFIPITAVVLLSIPLFLTHKGYYKLSKYILTIIPSYTVLLLSSMVKSHGFMNNIIIFVAPKILLYSLLVTPFLFFGVRKKKDLVISLIILLPTIIFFEKIHLLFGVEIEKLTFDPQYYTFFVVLLTIFFTVVYLSILFLQVINLENVSALKETAKKIKKQNIELEFSAHLFSILQITSQTNKSLNLILKEVLTEFLSIDKLGLDRKGVIFLKNKKGEFELIAQENTNALVDSCSIIKSGQCLCGKVLDSKVNMFCNKVHHAHDIMSVGMKPRGHYVVSIMNKDKVLGIFNMCIKVDEKKNKIVEEYLHATTEILARKIISEQHLEKIEKQKSIISISLKGIKDSLNYATHLQESLLPSQITIDKVFKKSYFIYLPKDMVSGDFYFAHNISKYKYFGIGDCTGHGIPGAFLSVMSIETVNQVLFSMVGSTPEKILEALRLKTKLRFANNRETNYRDVMDMALCRYDENTKEFLYSGANINLVIVRDGELIEYKSTRNPIGAYLKEIPFQLHKLTLNSGDIIYLYSDGLNDQFGFSKNRDKQTKLKRKGVHNILLSVQNLPFESHRSTILDKFNEWKNNLENTDDVTLFALKID